MDEKEKQKQEIERLKKKLDTLSEAYQYAVQELDRLKKENQKRSKGRPPVSAEKKAKVRVLYQRGNTMREIAGKEQLALSTVQKIIAEAAKKARIVYVFSDREQPATIIDACNFTEKVKILNLTDNMISRAFGVKEVPDWNDYEAFLESRCMPRTRYGIQDELRQMGLDFYDPFLIIQKTAGRVYGDHQYLIRMQQDWIDQFDELIKKTRNASNKRELLLEFMRRTEKEWKLNEDEY